MSDGVRPKGPIKLWLDDVRPAPEDWIWVKTAPDAFKVLATGNVGEVSLDHDLGDDPLALDGYIVATWIDEAAQQKRIRRLRWRVHSANPVGRAWMEAALRSADRWWEAHEDPWDDAEHVEAVRRHAEAVYEDLDRDDMICAEATQGPWYVWDGPAYEGGGKDLCIGAWDEECLAAMDHRGRAGDPEQIAAHAHDRVAGDVMNLGDRAAGRPGACPICSMSEAITAEQAANARLIVEARTRWPLRVEQLRKALDRSRRVGMSARDAAWMIRDMPDKAAAVDIAIAALDGIAGQVWHLLPDRWGRR
jgi:hypothetical protein